MTRWSIFAAVAAVLLSLFLHGLGLRFTAVEDPPPPTEDGTSDLADTGGAFEDFAEIITATAEPEPTPAPDPPDVTSPEQASDDMPTSQALVASDNPQDVTAPDTGTVDVIEPDAAEPSETAPAPEPAERSGGEDDTIADVAVSQPVEPEGEAEPPEGMPDDSAVSAEITEAALAPTTESVSATPAPAPSTAVIPDSEVQQPVLPEITVAPEPDDPEVLTAEESDEGPGTAVTSSLRPRERPSAVASGVPDGVRQEGDQTGSATGTIESPLTTYKRTGIDPFASGSSTARTGMAAFSGSRNPGNASTTNYVGRVLVQLNRSRVVHPEARGTAEVSFAINPDGTVAWVRILGSTGSSDIERAASAQVRSAAPFPPPPQGTSPRMVFVYTSK